MESKSAVSHAVALETGGASELLPLPVLLGDYEQLSCSLSLNEPRRNMQIICKYSIEHVVSSPRVDTMKGQRAVKFARSAAKVLGQLREYEWEKAIWELSKRNNANI